MHWILIFWIVGTAAGSAEFNDGPACKAAAETFEASATGLTSHHAICVPKWSSR
jgi:hypothetical protein